MISYGFGATKSNDYPRAVNILIAEDSEMSRNIVRDVLKVPGANRLNYAESGMHLE